MNLNLDIKNSDIDNLLYATNLTNFIKNDTIIDYLNILNENNYVVDTKDNLKVRKKKRSFYETCQILDTKKITKTSFEYIFENGYLFEESIINKIYNIMSHNNELDKILNIHKKLSKKNKYKQTLEAFIQNKYDIILGAFVINKYKNIGGFPDLIVNGLWIKKYIKYFNNTLNNLNEINLNNDIDNKTYYIIDIKSSNINLINKGEMISNLQKFKIYKMQVYVYKKAIEDMLSIIKSKSKFSNYGFLLGKKYTYVDNKIHYYFDSFDILGTYIFTENDEHDLNCAIHWNMHLKENWKTMQLYPINDEYLHPNMKNTFDGKYKKIKYEIAKENKEITLLYNCGITQRNNAFMYNIKRYDDLDLTTDILGFKDTSSKNIIITKMLELNRTIGNSKNELIYLSDKNNHNNWQTKYTYEFYVDFETYYEHTTNNNILYMIGVGIELNNQYMYMCFVTEPKENSNNLKENYIYCTSENNLINKFIEYITVINNNDSQNTRLIHWSHAEPSILKTKLIEYNININLPWFDLLEVFKNSEYPIIIKECHSFGLKSIISKLNEYKFVDLKWNELDDGLLSSFIAHDIYKGIKDSDNMIEIIKYNYIDCYALHILLNFIRNYIK